MMLRVVKVRMGQFADRFLGQGKPSSPDCWITKAQRTDASLLGSNITFDPIFIAVSHQFNCCVRL